MCVVESCDRKPIAKGLCAKHYMRVRRAGDPSTVGKPGRKRSPERLPMEEMGVSAEWSPRTFARFKQAIEMLREVGGVEEVKQPIEAATRSNRSLNVSKLVRIAAMRYIERCKSEPWFTEMYGTGKTHER